MPRDRAPVGGLAFRWTMVVVHLSAVAKCVDPQVWLGLQVPQPPLRLDELLLPVLVDQLQGGVRSPCPYRDMRWVSLAAEGHH